MTGFFKWPVQVGLTASDFVALEKQMARNVFQLWLSACDSGILKSL